MDFFESAFNQQQNFIDLKNFVKIPKGTILFRAIIDKNNSYKSFENLKPNYCEDTNKNGLYFSIITPTLSEFMSLEYIKPVVIGIFILDKDIEVNNGKYTEPIRTEGHIDIEVEPLSVNYQNLPPSYEVFIPSKDLKYVRYTNYYYKMSIQDVLDKYEDFYIPKPLENRIVNILFVYNNGAAAFSNYLQTKYDKNLFVKPIIVEINEKEYYMKWKYTIDFSNVEASVRMNIINKIFDDEYVKSVGKLHKLSIL